LPQGRAFLKIAAEAPGRTSVSANYAGDVSPREAWNILSSDEKAVLIDVRTAPEWSFVGVPDLGSLGKQVVRQSWQNYPRMEIDPDFAAQLSAAIADRDAPLLFLCRSGARSRSAAMAMTQVGYRRCYNIATGFEGNHDQERHRGSAAGWKADGLPWVQD
jgi:rhodanese-related sulfurtransferase